MFHVKHSLEDTITAIATPLGEGGVGIIRVSGPSAHSIFSQLFITSNGYKLESHHLAHGWIVDPLNQVKIDEGMACFMAAPKTFTGEDVIEFHCHGSMVVLRQVLNMTINAGARLAERGEFTKRAFLNHKIDLSQAEAVIDLVKAITPRGAGYAVNQLMGRLSKEIKSARQKLIVMQAELEAQIDFSDDFPPFNADIMAKKLSLILKELKAFSLSAPANRIFHHGLATVIVGRPNVGKSSLLNALLGEERAIVTEIPGTTRDAIEEMMEIDGLPFRFIDTAGLGEAKDRAEELGVARAEKELAAADLAIVVIDASQPIDLVDMQIWEKATRQPRLLVMNKADLGVVANCASLVGAVDKCRTVIVSAGTGERLDDLKKALSAAAKEAFVLEGPHEILLNARHQACLNRAMASLESAIRFLSTINEPDIVAIDIKEALGALGEISGEQVSEEIINEIFNRFCVGK
ncbi:tRNA uridine-5-carboxymethylaminomethyl(34) synthesis GTPase MnmE [Candidatus Saganbacteria bacterium]|nr:tRNA uridine-5-carboxymethylaminomethyl(34) synthesis GTPase MnmE [Candidatus Saganbacteria bacterium]